MRVGPQDISNDLWIIGVIAAAALVLSTVMAVIYFLFSLCGGAGAHICCAAVPLGYLNPETRKPLNEAPVSCVLGVRRRRRPQQLRPSVPRLTLKPNPRP